MNNMSKAFCIVAMAAIALADSAAARADAGVTNILGAMGVAPADRAVANDNSAIQVSTSTVNSTVSVRFARTESDLDLKNHLGTFSTWTLAASGPLNASGGPTPVATLDGLANSFTAKIKYSRLVVPGIHQDLAEAEAVVDRAVALCKLRFDADTAKSKCDPKLEEGLVAAYDKDDLDRYEAAFFANTGTDVTYGIQGSIGFNHYDFFDPATLIKQSTSRTPWGAMAYFGLLPHDMNLLATIGFEYQQTYAALPTGTACLPPPPVPLTCATGSLGQPKSTQKYLVSAELRSLVPLGWANALFGPATTGNDVIGLSPKFTYDAKSHVYGIDAPIYFVLDDKGSLTGGLQFGWTSDKHTLIAGLFVGSAFSIF